MGDDVSGPRRARRHRPRLPPVRSRGAARWADQGAHRWTVRREVPAGGPSPPASRGRCDVGIAAGAARTCAVHDGDRAADRRDAARRRRASDPAGGDAHRPPVGRDDQRRLPGRTDVDRLSRTSCSARSELRWA